MPVVHRMSGVAAHAIRKALICLPVKRIETTLGAAGRIRTVDLPLTRRPLYRLSYNGMGGLAVSHSPASPLTRDMGSNTGPSSHGSDSDR